MNLTYSKIASNLNVSTATAQRVYTKFEHTGHVDPVLADRRDTRTLAIDEHQELHVIGLMLHEPSLYLGELCQQTQDTFGLELSPASVYRLFKRYGMTRKKIRQIAKQRCHSLREAFIVFSSVVMCLYG